MSWKGEKRSNIIPGRLHCHTSNIAPPRHQPLSTRLLWHWLFPGSILRTSDRILAMIDQGHIGILQVRQTGTSLNGFSSCRALLWYNSSRCGITSYKINQCKVEMSIYNTSSTNTPNQWKAHVPKCFMSSASTQAIFFKHIPRIQQMTLFKSTNFITGRDLITNNILGILKAKIVTNWSAMLVGLLSSVYHMMMIRTCKLIINEEETWSKRWAYYMRHKPRLHVRLELFSALILFLVIVDDDVNIPFLKWISDIGESVMSVLYHSCVTSSQRNHEAKVWK